MKKISKVLSLLLALLIAFTTVSIAFAAKEPEQTCPVILIPGFTSSDVYDNIEDPDTRVDFPSTDDIIDIVTQEFIPGLLNYAVDRDTDKLVVRVTSRINEIFAYWFNEPTGEAKKGSGIIPQKLTDVTGVVILLKLQTSLTSISKPYVSSADVIRLLSVVTLSAQLSLSPILPSTATREFQLWF